MSAPAIRVEKIGKRYRVGLLRDAHPTLRDAIVEGARAMQGRLHGAIRRRRQAGGVAADARAGTFWALRDVSFTVDPGEVVGVVGGNGAGKSTLLKILSRITSPTEGGGVLRGRVGSLLEVGTGFHPELTGRENVFLNGVIIGMTRHEITRRFDEIVAFSGVEAFIDTPVKRYSSGMYLRLAFSVAAHLEPEILLIDEVLAVGDAEFQKKCLGKIGDVSRSGRTVLFVSHNLTAVQALCGRCIHLSKGRVVADGEPRAVIGRYLGSRQATSTEHVWNDGTGAAVELRRAAVRPANGAASDVIDVRTPFVIELEYASREPGALVAASFLVIDEHGTVVFNAGPREAPVPLAPGVYRDACAVPGDLMNDGTYRLEVELRSNGDLVVPPTPALAFAIADSAELRGGWHGKWIGAVRPIFGWTTTKVG
jgi:lipopolysaccharide transport system ATP-binding protein